MYKKRHNRCRKGDHSLPQRATPSRAVSAEALIFIVDDDDEGRRALSRLFSSVGHQVRVFGSAAEFLASTLPDVPSCLVLDVRLPGLSGLDFHHRLAEAQMRFEASVEVVGKLATLGAIPMKRRTTQLFAEFARNFAIA